MPDPDLSKLEGGYTPVDDSVLAKLEGGASEFVQGAKDTALAARDSAAQSAGQSAQETPNEQLRTLKHGATMVPAGATWNNDDELIGIIGGIGAALGKPLTDPRTTAPKGYRMQRDAQRGRKAEATSESPFAAGAGYLTGAVAQQAVGGAALRGATGVGGKIGRLALGTEKAAEGASLGNKVATGVGNLALPGALTGAGQAESLEDVPEAALTGAGVATAIGTALKLPGGIRRWAGRAGNAETAAAHELEAKLRARGFNRGQSYELSKKPGGKEQVVRDQERLGIGKGMIPTVRKSLNQADAAVNRLDVQAAVLAEQAKHLNIPVEELAAEMERKGKALPQPAGRHATAKYVEEAEEFRKTGKPIYETIGGRDAPERLYEPPPPTGPVEATIEDMGPRRGYAQVKPQAPPPGPVVTPPPAEPPWQGPPMPRELPENGLKRPVVTPSPRQGYPELGEGPTRVQGRVVGNDPLLGPGNPEVQAEARPLTPAQGRVVGEDPALPSGQGTDLALPPIQAQAEDVGPIQARSQWRAPLAKADPAAGPPMGRPGGGPLAPAQGEALATTPGGALAKRQQDALVAGDPWSETEMVGREMTFPELVENRRFYHDQGYQADKQVDTLAGDRYRDFGASINDILEKYANKELPGEVGTQLRGLNRDLSTAITAREAAQKKVSGGSDLGRGAQVFGGTMAAGAGALNPATQVPAAAGFLASHPGVQQRFWQGAGAVARAAQRAPQTTLGRVLTRYGPSGENLGRLAASASAQESVTAVQEAALKGDDEAVSEHYRKMLTDPAYNRLAMEGEE